MDFNVHMYVSFNMAQKRGHGQKNTYFFKLLFLFLCLSLEFLGFFLGVGDLGSYCGYVFLSDIVIIYYLCVYLVNIVYCYVLIVIVEKLENKELKKKQKITFNKGFMSYIDIL